MINSIIHHLGIGFVSPESAESFFDRLLVDYLGMNKEVTTEAVAGWKGRGSRIYLYPVKGSAAMGTLQHLAFTARTQAEVDYFVEWAALHNIPVVHPPRFYPEYGGDYYAVFFQGPENLKLELVYLSEQDCAKPL
jgi:hypothetical protein